jgi:hypothetical protein
MEVIRHRRRIDGLCQNLLRLIYQNHEAEDGPMARKLAMFGEVGLLLLNKSMQGGLKTKAILVLF